MSRFLFAIAFLFALTSCSISTQDTGYGWPGQGANPNKPEPSDFSGNVANFAGHYQGTCTMMINGAKDSGCTMTLDISQDSASGQGYISGSMNYVVDLSGPAAPMNFHVYQINGNTLLLNGQNVGQIGQRALQVWDDTFVNLSLRQIGSGTLGINMVRVPNFNSGAACSVSSPCFYGQVSRIN